MNITIKILQFLLIKYFTLSTRELFDGYNYDIKIQFAPRSKHTASML